MRTAVHRENERRLGIVCQRRQIGQRIVATENLQEAIHIEMDFEMRGMQLNTIDQPSDQDRALGRRVG